MPSAIDRDQFFSVDLSIVRSPHAPRGGTLSVAGRRSKRPRRYARAPGSRTRAAFSPFGRFPYDRERWPLAGEQKAMVMRIVHYIPDFGLGGVQKAGCVLAEGMTRLGHLSWVLGDAPGPRLHATPPRGLTHQ